MIDFALTIEIIASIMLVVAPAVVLGRLSAGADGPTLSDVLRIPQDPPWPRGVQEEEPVRWRLDRIERRPVGKDSVAVGCQPGICPTRAPRARATG